MTSPNRLFVISDIHMGAADGHNIFFASNALCRFIEHVACTPGEVELVILGDGLDYLQIEPYLCFDRDVAVDKTLRIIDHNVEVFDSLHRYLADSNHTLRWFIGNHDLELAFPDVRRVIEEKIRGDGRGVLIWSLTGERQVYPLTSGGAIYLAHGNKGDMWNEVSYDEVNKQAQAGGAGSSIYPYGSHLVADVINPLKRDGLTHIDLLKPEIEVALPLAIACWPDRAATYLRRLAGLSIDVKQYELKRMLNPTTGALTFGDIDTSTVTSSLGHLLVRTLYESLGRTGGGAVRDEDIDGVIELLNCTKAPATAPGPATFSGAEPTALFPIVKTVVKRATAGDASFVLEQRDDRCPMVEKSHAEGARLVVLGHTHLARAVSLPRGDYLNTGTWADLMRLPPWLADEEYPVVLKQLRTHLRNATTAPWYLRPLRKLTYVEIEFSSSGGTYLAALRQWPEGPGVTLASL